MKRATRSSAPFAFRAAPGLLAAVALAALGCAGKAPPVHYYTLEGRPPLATPAAEGRTILVGPLVVDPPYDQDRLVYRLESAAAEIGFYNYHRWAAPLGQLIAVALAADLEGTAGVAGADPSATRAHYDTRLTGRVIHFAEVDTASGAAAEIAIEFRLVDAQGGELWTGLLTGRSAGAIRSPGWGAQAMQLVQRAFGDLSDQLQERVAAVFAGS
jgi:uncharacterized lipoprotein YmbA